jgi:hypothetical protein
MAAVLLTACSDDVFDPLGLDGGNSTSVGEPEPMVDYGECDRTMQDPDCVGTECGRTPQAQEYLGVMLEVVAEAGHASAFAPTRAEFHPLTNELHVDYQLHVGWFRAASVLDLQVPDSDEILREELEAHVGRWAIAPFVVSPDQISAAIEACHSILAYDPCEDNQPAFVAHDAYDWSQPGCVYKSSYAVIDAVDASTLECVVEQEHPCD